MKEVEFIDLRNLSKYFILSLKKTQLDNTVRILKFRDVEEVCFKVKPFKWVLSPLKKNREPFSFEVKMKNQVCLGPNLVLFKTLKFFQRN